MTSKLTREALDDETLAELIAFRRSRVEYCQKEGLPYQKVLHDSMMLALEELQERRKAAMDSEPVAYMYDGEDGLEYNGHNEFSSGGKGIPLYRHAQQPVVEPVSFDDLRDAVAEMSGGLPMEWDWPDLSKGHQAVPFINFNSLSRIVEKFRVTAQPAPVVPDAVDEGIDADDHPLLWSHNKGWNACRAAMLQAGNPPVIPDGYVMVPKEPTTEILDEFDSIIDYGAEDSVEAWRRLLAAAPHDTPVLNSLQSVDSVADRWIPVSERMPEEGQHIIIFCDDAFVLSAQHRDGDFFDVVRDGEEFFETTSRCVTHWMPLPAAPQEQKL